MGRTTSQGSWEAKPNWVCHIFTPLDGEGTEKTLNQRDLLDGRAMVLDEGEAPDAEHHQSEVPVLAAHRGKDDEAEDDLIVIKKRGVASGEPAACYKAGELQPASEGEPTTSHKAGEHQHSKSYHPEQLDDSIGTSSVHTSKF